MRNPKILALQAVLKKPGGINTLGGLRAAVNQLKATGFRPVRRMKPKNPRFADKSQLAVSQRKHDRQERGRAARSLSAQRQRMWNNTDLRPKRS